MRIKAWMERNGLTQTQVAEAIGVSRPSVFKWCVGMSYPTADKLPALAKLFHCTIDELFDRAPSAADDAAS